MARSPLRLLPAVIAALAGDECVTCKDNTFPQLLLLVEFAHDAADRIYKAIVAPAPRAPRLKPILRPYDTVGSTRYVDFDTTKPVYDRPGEMPHLPRRRRHRLVGAEDGADARGHARGGALREEPGARLHDPVHINGEERQYNPDFIAAARRRVARGPLNLIIEVSGEAKKDKAAKVSTARTCGCRRSTTTAGSALGVHRDERSVGREGRNSRRYRECGCRRPEAGAGSPG